MTTQTAASVFKFRAVMEVLSVTPIHPSAETLPLKDHQSRMIHAEAHKVGVMNGASALAQFPPPQHSLPPYLSYHFSVSR